MTRILSPARLPVPPLARAARWLESSRWASLALAAWAVGLSWIAFWPLLGKPYAFDDLAVLAAVARWRDSADGASGLVPLLFAPHNEHLLPGVRLLFAASTTWFGSDATVVHLLLAAAHGLGGWAIGTLVRWCDGSAAGAFAATSLYVAAATVFAPSAVWYATGAVVMLSWVATLLGTRSILLTPNRPGRGAALALCGLTATTGGLPGLLAPWAAMLWPGGSDSLRPAKDRRWWPAVLLSVVAVLVLLGTRAVYGAFSGRPFPALHPRGLLASAILIGSAPGRAIEALLPLQLVGSLPLPVTWVLGWATATLGWLLAPLRLRRATTIVFAGSVALSMALGLLRPEYRLADFIGADRYYYPLLAPWCLAVAGLFIRLRHAVLAWLLVVLCASPILTGRGPFLNRFPASGLRIFETYWSRADRLASAIREEASASPPPWRLADGSVELEGLPVRPLSLSAILSTTRKVGGDRRPGMEFGGTEGIGPGARDVARQNAALDRWGESLGEPVTPHCVVDGVLARPRVRPGSRIDFAGGSHGAAVVSGFEGWTRPFRFMTEAPAVLRLTLAPGDLEVAAWVPNLGAMHPPIQLTAALDGRVLGTATVAPGGEREVRFANPASPVAPDAPSAPGALGDLRGPSEGMRSGRTVEVTLRASPSWRPVDHLAGNADARQLTLAVLRVAFAGQSEGAAPATSTGAATHRCSDPSS